MSTEFPSKNGINRQWHVIDAEDVVSGQAGQQGGHAADGQDQTHLHSVPGYRRSRDRRSTPSKVRLTGRKEEDKVYRHFTGYPGGLVETNYQAGRAETRPTRMVEEAIRGMLPKTKLGKQMYPEIEGLRG